MSGNNTAILDRCIRDYRAEYGVTESDPDMFESFVAQLVTKRLAPELDDIQPSIVDGTDDGGIDSFLIVYNDDFVNSRDEGREISLHRSGRLEIHIIQSKWEPTLKESVLDKLLSTMPIVLALNGSESELQSRFNEQLRDRILTFRDLCIGAAAKGTSISIEYHYAARAETTDVSAAFQSKVEQLIALTTSKIADATVRLRILGARDLYRLFHERDPETLVLKFRAQPTPVRYGDKALGYVGIVKLKDYCAFIRDTEGRLREELFDSNVRHFQGDVDVNSKIAKTLRDDISRDFWWLNNGITVIASHARPLDTDLNLDDVQIVNGLQTSFTIHNVFPGAESDERSVLVKVIQSTDKETIDKVISATNSQTQVAASSLFATQEIQRALELYFETKGYYYDRRKNYYRSQGKPKGRIFSIQVAAQSIFAILKNGPSTARARPTSMIRDKYDDIFRLDMNYDVALKCCLIHQSANKFMYANTTSAADRVWRNFVFHLARVAVARAAGTAFVNDAIVHGLSLTDIEAVMGESLDVIKRLVSKYEKLVPGSAPANIAKSAKFDAFLIEEVMTA